MAIAGRLDGMKFRLANVDAPETGGIGSIGGAKCELERERGFEAKAFMVEATKGKVVEIAETYGPDRYDREVLDLSVDGESLAALAIAAGPYPTLATQGAAGAPAQAGLVRANSDCGLTRAL